MKKAVVITNLERDKDAKGAKKVAKILAKHGVTPIMSKDMQQYKIKAEFVDIATEKDVDLAVIIGGDGTFLSHSKQYINTDTPVLGINYGNIGFLTELEQHDEESGLLKVLEGKYILEKLPIIKVTHHEDVSLCINEVTVYRAFSPKMIDTEIIIEGVSMNKFRADGLIISTSSGSTAYSMSAGGPIVNPSVKAFIITPICPHNLHLRSIVVPMDANIEVKINNADSKCALSVDGNMVSELEGAHTIKIEHGGYLNTIRQDEKSFYNKLKKKFFEKEI